MAPAMIGKRSRQTTVFEEQLLALPSKRARKAPRPFSSDNDENVDPASCFTIHEEEEPAKEDTHIKPSAVERTPSKPHVKTISFYPVTPSTPRHRDGFVRPSPVTPRHKVMSVGKLFKRLTPSTPGTPSAVNQTIYHQARQVFSRSADPGQLTGREQERETLRQFLSRWDSKTPNGCLYVSGPPGTGKSALVSEITAEVVSAATSTVRKSYVNCMSIKSSRDLYATLHESLSDESDLSEGDLLSALEKMFITKKKSADVFVVILDEIDHILSLDLESLYRMFDWSLQKSSRLILVGIANALDLTDRFLPRLKARNMKPDLLPFLPYTTLQIKEILTKRLRSLLPDGCSNPGYLPFMHPVAIELCCRKISSQTGDLRKAFEICRRAIDLVEADTRLEYEVDAKKQLAQMTPSRKVLGENSNLASPDAKRGKSISAMVAESWAALTVETAPRVSVAHLNKVTAAVFSNGTSQRLKALNLQQKAALCALVAIEKRNRAAAKQLAAAALDGGPHSTPSKSSSQRHMAPTIKTLFDTYTILCKRDSVLHPLSSSEFREVIGSLETLSLVTGVNGKTGSLVATTGLQTPGSGRKGRKMGAFMAMGGEGDERRIASCVGENELEMGIEGVGEGILREVLSGEALD